MWARRVGAVGIMSHLFVQPTWVFRIALRLTASVPLSFDDRVFLYLASSWVCILDNTWGLMITWYSMVRISVSISKPRTVFPKEISYCLKKTWLCSKTLEASTVFSSWSVPDAICIIWIYCKHFEYFKVCGNKGPCGSSLEQLQNLPLI